MLLIEEAQKIHAEDIEVNKAIGRWGAQFIKDGDTVLTHCNAGSSCNRRIRHSNSANVLLP